MLYSMAGLQDARVGFKHLLRQAESAGLRYPASYPTDVALAARAGSRDVTRPMKEIANARPMVVLTSVRCSGVIIITASAAQMNRMTSQVSHGNNHMRKASSTFYRRNMRRMRSCDTAIARYTSKAMAPELASRNSNRPAGMK